MSQSQSQTLDAAPTAHETTDDDDARLLAHDYDGIQEFDNPLPGWWSMIFYGTIVFALAYWIVFQLTDWTKTTDEKYREAKLAYMAKHDEESTAVAASSEEELSAGGRDAAMVARGKGIFVARCAMCHTPEGKGLVGPNLTDLYQIHGTTRLDLFTTIRDGAPNTAMIAWGTQLSATDIVSVASFVSSLQGTNVPGGKAPQGEPVKPYAP